MQKTIDLKNMLRISKSDIFTCEISPKEYQNANVSDD